MATAPPETRPSLLAREHLPFATGAVALVTLGAFENRAVSTVLPTVARDLDGLWLFGAASAAPLVTFVVATTVAGLWSDRRGPRPVLLAGMASFVAGQLLSGLAPTMTLFVGGRLLGGLAEGLFDVGLTVLVARALPASLRPKVFATFAAAWVLPSLLGPSIAGLVAEQVGWRAVFLIGVVLLGPVAALLRPAMSSAPARSGGSSSGSSSVASTGVATPAADGPSQPEGPVPSRAAGWAVVAATGLAALTAGGSLLPRGGLEGPVGGLLVLVGIAALVPSLRAILPAGTLTGAPGIPALTAARGLLGAAFGTTGGLLPLMLTEVHHAGPAAAGVSLTITGLFWALGSQVQGLRVVQDRTSVATRLRIGFGLLTLGMLGPVALSLEVVPMWLGLAAWAVAGIGTGISSPAISNHVLTLSTEADQGRNSAASFLAPSVTQAVAFAASGAVIAWRADQLGGGVFAVIMAGSVAAAAAGLALARRAAGPAA
ncbi:MFS transporter [Phycicoccus sp. M110.8]|uniref:MFS transporter n=1 Tax=Phycicoccus sp. M110.8 TaxID=3075433 RepID=UPI0028FD90D5|nr:MFS transporter [Phycicoccus sp. M110.8]MDU0313477.1 MFS transporter [Phycicoccus sp. M110.8]